MLVGHAHTACATSFAGVPVLVGGRHRLHRAARRRAAPTIWEDAPVSLALHLLVEGRLVTHFRTLATRTGWR